MLGFLVFSAGSMTCQNVGHLIELYVGLMVVTDMVAMGYIRFILFCFIYFALVFFYVNLFLKFYRTLITLITIS